MVELTMKHSMVCWVYNAQGSQLTPDGWFDDETVCGLLGGHTCWIPTADSYRKNCSLKVGPHGSIVKCTTPPGYLWTSPTPVPANSYSPAVERIGGKFRNADVQQAEDSVNFGNLSNGKTPSFYRRFPKVFKMQVYRSSRPYTICVDVGAPPLTDKSSGKPPTMIPSGNQQHKLENGTPFPVGHDQASDLLIVQRPLVDNQLTIH